MIRRGGEGEEERERREGEEGGRRGEGEDIPIDGPCLLINPAPVDKIMVSDIQLFPTNYLSLSV